jgi:enoyl-CoA hydratase
VDSVITITDANRVRYLTLNRPDRLNALNSSVLRELVSHLDSAATDPTVGCVVIRGSGGRAFCAGADLDEISGLDIEQAHAFIRGGHRAMSAVESSPVPVIAAVDGYALGGGLELMLACQIAIASDRSSFGLPEAKIGCIPGFGGTQRLLTASGKAAAFHLMLTGQRVDAARAWSIGLLSVPPVATAEFDAEVAELAGTIAAGSRGGLRNILEAARQAADPNALEHEAALAAIAIASADGQEGIRSFAEQRSPAFDRSDVR